MTPALILEHLSERNIAYEIGPGWISVDYRNGERLYYYDTGTSRHYLPHIPERLQCERSTTPEAFCALATPARCIPRGDNGHWRIQAVRDRLAELNSTVKYAGETDVFRTKIAGYLYTYTRYGKANKQLAGDPAPDYSYHKLLPWDFADIIDHADRKAMQAGILTLPLFNCITT